MTTLPIPIVVAMMLVLLAAVSHHQLRETATGKTFALMLYTYALSMVFVGLRWSLDDLFFLRFAATLAVISTVLLYLAFRSLGLHPLFKLQRDWPHLLPLAVMIAVALLDPSWTDAALVLIKLLYAVLLIRLARRAPTSLQLTRLDWLMNSQRALWIAACLLLFSAAIDVSIALDFILFQGRHAASLVGVVNLFSVLLIGWAAVYAGRGSAVIDGKENTVPDTDPVTRATTHHAPDERYGDKNGPNNGQTTGDSDNSMLQQLNTLLTTEKLYADPNLNLQKLARKAGVPTRVISRTINAATQQNVSQWVNSARIEAACALLKNSDISVTEAMMQAGFSTKSNFNREFKRITGLSPSAWREQQRGSD